MPLKLFIWEGDGVLTDYTDGMIIAIGRDLEQALKVVEKKCAYCMRSFPTHRPTQVIDLDHNLQPEAWVCYGGG